MNALECIEQECRCPTCGGKCDENSYGHHMFHGRVDDEIEDVGVRHTCPDCRNSYRLVDDPVCGGTAFRSINGSDWPEADSCRIPDCINGKVPLTPERWVEAMLELREAVVADYQPTVSRGKRTMKALAALGEKLITVYRDSPPSGPFEKHMMREWNRQQ